jgi:glutathione S-transferase
MPSRHELTLYELAAADPALRFSPHCWKTRMALAHKELEAEGLPWRFSDKQVIAFSGQGRVPVLVDQGTVVADSWRIALHLEERFPDRPSLFRSEECKPLAHFVNSWADSMLVPAIARIVLVDIYSRIDEKDKPYFRRSREERFGGRLEEVVADRPARLADFRNALAPLRLMLQERPYIAGAAAGYADYCVFGMFMWIRCVSNTEVLEPADPVAAWRARLLDAFGGMARSAPSVQL